MYVNMFTDTSHNIYKTEILCQFVTCWLVWIALLIVKTMTNVLPKFRCSIVLETIMQEGIKKNLHHLMTQTEVPLLQERLTEDLKLYVNVPHGTFIWLQTVSIHFKSDASLRPAIANKSIRKKFSYFSSSYSKCLPLGQILKVKNISCGEVKRLN